MTAPSERIVEAFTGTIAPSKFFQALAEADGHVEDAAEVERLREENAELHIRVAELKDEQAALRGQLFAAADEVRSLNLRLADAKKARVSR